MRWPGAGPDGQEALLRLDGLLTALTRTTVATPSKAALNSACHARCEAPRPVHPSQAVAAGVWEYEVRAEALAKNAGLVREGQLKRAQAALAAATPTVPRRAAVALASLVATAPGDDLRRIAAAAPMLTEDDAAALTAAAALDTEAAYVALVAVLDTRARESALGEWLELARSADDVAPPLAAPPALATAAREVHQDLAAAIRHHAYWERCAPLLPAHAAALARARCRVSGSH